jgi:hypothetical protein
MSEARWHYGDLASMSSSGSCSWGVRNLARDTWYTNTLKKHQEQQSYTTAMLLSALRSVRHPHIEHSLR